MQDRSGRCNIHDGAKGKDMDVWISCWDSPDTEGSSHKGSDTGERFRNGALHGQVGLQSVVCPIKVGTYGATQMISSCWFFPRGF